MKKMLKAFCMVAGLTAALAASAQAAGRNFGLGFEVGDPTGFTGKYWTSGTTALDFNVGWSGYWHRDGYYDPSCYDAHFYDAHVGYCNDRAYDYRDTYGYGWRIFHVHADYLFHNFDAIRATERFPIFYGPGISFDYLDYHYSQLGVRGDFGIAWLPRRSPIDLFFEIAPVIELFPGPDFEVNGGFGARFYF